MYSHLGSPGAAGSYENPVAESLFRDAVQLPNFGSGRGERAGAFQIHGFVGVAVNQTNQRI
jgi:hypothetical protein